MVSNGDFIIYRMSGCEEIILVTNDKDLLGIDSLGQESQLLLHQNITAKSYQTIDLVPRDDPRWAGTREEFNNQFQSWKDQVMKELKTAEEALEIYK